MDAVLVHHGQPACAGSHVAGSVSAKRRGWYGGYSGHPAIAGAADGAEALVAA